MDFIDTIRKARKPHKCYMCGCTIEAGTEYVRQFNTEYKSTICMHKECQELLGYEGFYNEDDYGTDDDFFHNAIFDYVNEHHLSADGKAFNDGWEGDILQDVNDDDIKYVVIFDEGAFFAQKEGLYIGIPLHECVGSLGNDVITYAKVVGNKFDKEKSL